MAGFEQFADQVRQVTNAMESAPKAFALRNATRIDASGIVHGWWMVADQHGVISATGIDPASAGTDNADLPTSNALGASSGEADDGGFGAACQAAGLDPSAKDGSVVDVKGAIVTPGYIDIHSHGGWGAAFDDGPDAIDTARACHAWHGTTRQVCSLITNPVDVMCRNIKTLHQKMSGRPDILGSHLEGPFLALSRKGAHDPKCLRDPDPATLGKLLDAGDGSIRQITFAPELRHGFEAIHLMRQAGVIPAVGHTDADYETARRAFALGAGILTHMFNAMNGMHHRKPGPIPAALENPQVAIELINDGFHIHNPMLRVGLALAGKRTVFITDAMSATGCPDGHYKLGQLAVTVRNGHARLDSNGAIAGSTLLLERSVQRAVQVLGMPPADAVRAATLAPAHALGLDRPNSLMGAPLGLLGHGFAADALVLDPATWQVRHVWCAGREVR